MHAKGKQRTENHLYTRKRNRIEKKKRMSKGHEEVYQKNKIKNKWFILAGYTQALTFKGQGTQIDITQERNLMSSNQT